MINEGRWRPGPMILYLVVVVTGSPTHQLTSRPGRTDPFFAPSTLQVLLLASGPRTRVTLFQNPHESTASPSGLVASWARGKAPSKASRRRHGSAAVGPLSPDDVDGHVTPETRFETLVKRRANGGAGFVGHLLEKRDTAGVRGPIICKLPSCGKPCRLVAELPVCRPAEASPGFHLPRQPEGPRMPGRPWATVLPLSSRGRWNLGLSTPCFSILVGGGEGYWCPMREAML
jgi:hypothetical protein